MRAGLQSLLKNKAVVFSDEKVHASIIDGIRLSRCEKYIWGHNQVSELEILLRQKAKPDFPGEWPHNLPPPQ